MILGAAGDRIERVGCRRRLRSNGKKEIRLCKEDVMCVAVTVRLLQIRCLDTTNED
jgi:hypothetical protein